MAEAEPTQGSAYVPFEKAPVWSDAEECRDAACAIPGRHMHVPAVSRAEVDAAHATLPSAQECERRARAAQAWPFLSRVTVAEVDAARAAVVDGPINRAYAVLEKRGLVPPRAVVEMVEACRPELSSVLHELAGRASMCWEPPPAGVFQSDLASDAAKDAGMKVVALVHRLKVVALVHRHVTVNRETDAEDLRYARVGRDLVAILGAHVGPCGNGEGAVEVLQRLIRERAAAQRQIAELDPEIVKRVSAEMRKAPPR